MGKNNHVVTWGTITSVSPTSGISGSSLKFLGTTPAPVVVETIPRPVDNFGSPIDIVKELHELGTLSTKFGLFLDIKMLKAL